MWLNLDNSIVRIPKDAVGFVYIITNKSTGKFYVGKKMFFYKRKRKLTKKEKVSTRARFITESKDSGWEDYYGSSKELLTDVKNYGKSLFEKTVLKYAYSKKQLSYLELEYMIKYDVLREDTYNGNILGRFYRKDLM